MENMGDRIKRLRQERGLTLQEVGDAVGVGKSTVRKWETGMIANMKRDKIAKLADVLRVSPEELMGWKTREHDESLSGSPSIKELSLQGLVIEKIENYDDAMLKRLLSYLEFFEKMNGGDKK